MEVQKFPKYGKINRWNHLKDQGNCSCSFPLQPVHGFYYFMTLYLLFNHFVQLGCLNMILEYIFLFLNSIIPTEFCLIGFFVWFGSLFDFFKSKGDNRNNRVWSAMQILYVGSKYSLCFQLSQHRNIYLNAYLKIKYLHNIFISISCCVLMQNNLESRIKHFTVT